VKIALRRRRVMLLAASQAATMAGCAGPPERPPKYLWPRFKPLLLFGEVHDNAGQHALRLDAVHALIAQGARPALLMEPFDRELQGSIDRARAAPGADADMVIAAARQSDTAEGWHWPHYRPVILLALQYHLPLVAANVSRADARRIMADGLAAHGFDSAVPPDIVAQLAEEIERNHCGLVGSAQARRMVLAQVARDQFMARQLSANAGRGAVLLAGNGHVRNDVGVPRWLTAEMRAQALTVGLLEEGTGGPTADRYDLVFVTPRQPRPDPCSGVLRPR
jgi:uncharacterized iron-regulated protein